ncbi:hypothetical protein ACWCPX_22355 [Streptomyces olivaceoviridis]
MDPAVTAALITTPTAVLAAAAAYAAGRAQARSAHRGPVDAVRRQHQRDAYAELARATLSYLSSIGSVQHLVGHVYAVRLDYDLAPDAASQLSEALARPGIRSSELADALAPHNVPVSLSMALGRLEQLSPTWRQDILGALQVDDVMRAMSVVTLEGPDHLAELAEQLGDRANSVRICWARAAALTPFYPFTRMTTEWEPMEVHSRLHDALEEFTRAARAHLNAH